MSKLISDDAPRLPGMKLLAESVVLPLPPLPPLPPLLSVATVSLIVSGCFHIFAPAFVPFPFEEERGEEEAFKCGGAN